MASAKRVWYTLSLMRKISTPLPVPGVDPKGTRNVTTRELSTRVEDTCWAGMTVSRSVLLIMEVSRSMGRNS